MQFPKQKHVYLFPASQVDIRRLRRQRVGAGVGRDHVAALPAAVRAAGEGRRVASLQLVRDRAPGEAVTAQF